MLTGLNWHVILNCGASFLFLYFPKKIRIIKFDFSLSYNASFSEFCVNIWVVFSWSFNENIKPAERPKTILLWPRLVDRRLERPKEETAHTVGDGSGPVHEPAGQIVHETAATSDLYTVTLSVLLLYFLQLTTYRVHTLYYAHKYRIIMSFSSQYMRRRHTMQFFLCPDYGKWHGTSLGDGFS